MQDQLEEDFLGLGGIRGVNIEKLMRALQLQWMCQE